MDGVAQNLENRNWNNVDVTLLLYDEDGNGLGSVSDYIDVVEAKGTWRFCATGTTKYAPASAKLHRIYAYGDNIFY